MFLSSATAWAASAPCAVSAVITAVLFLLLSR